jgi:hypothetical protein
MYKDYPILVLLLFFLSCKPVLSQKKHNLFSYYEKNYIEQSLGSEKRQWVHLNPNITGINFINEGDEINILFENQNFIFNVERKKQYFNDTYSIIGRHDENILVATIHNNNIIGVIHFLELGKDILIGYDTVENKNFISEITKHEQLECILEDVENFIDNNKETKINSIKLFNESETNNTTTIDLLIVYSDGANLYMKEKGGVNAFVSQIMALTQNALDISNTGINLNLVHLAPVSFNETGKKSSDILKYLSTNNDNIMDSVHTIRDSYNADLVSLLVDVSDVGGTAYLLGSRDGDPSRAFSLTAVRSSPFAYLFAHEIGHNLGNNHSRNQARNAAGPNGGVFPYSTGWRWTVGNISYATIMTYDQALDGVTSRKIPYFSNPDVKFLGSQTGSYSGLHSPSDNARSMRELKDIVAAYRKPSSSKIAAPVIKRNTPTGGTLGTQVTVEFEGSHFYSGLSVSWDCGSNLKFLNSSFKNSTSISVTWDIPITANTGICSIWFKNQEPTYGVSNIVEFKLDDLTQLPSISTEFVTNLTANSALTGGVVNSQGISPINSRGVCYALSSVTTTPSKANTCKDVEGGMGRFEVLLSDLDPESNYHVRSYASNSAGTSYGNAILFQTDKPVSPVVRTLSVSSIQSFSAIVYGFVSDEGLASLDSRGFCYSKKSESTEPTLSNSCIDSASGNTIFSSTLSNLTPSTIYYARAYASNSLGTGYGTILTFTTSNTRPVLNSIEPNMLALNSSADVTIMGNNFANGITLNFGDGIQISDLKFESNSTLKARFLISSSASVGTRNVTVSNPTPGGGPSTNTLTFTVTLPPPNLNNNTWVRGTTVPISTQPVFEWSPVPGASNYTVQISNQPGFPQKQVCSNCEESAQNNLTSTYTVNSNSFKVPNPLNVGTTYYWRLRANTTSTQGIWSDSYSFIVVSSPSKPVLLFPENGSNGLTGSVQLQWTPTSNTKRYELQVTGDLSFTNLIITTDTLSLPSFRMPPFSAGSPVDYIWRVRGIGVGGNGEWSPANNFTRAALTHDEDVSGPITFELHQNFPNPFNPSTQIQYSLPSSSLVTIEIFNTIGQRVHVIVDEIKTQGTHSITFDARGLTSGMYLYRLTTPEFTQTRMMSLVK